MVRPTIRVVGCTAQAVSAVAMSGNFFFAVGTVGQSTRAGRKPSTLLQAARHNRRKIQAEMGAHGHIDAGRIALNQTIAGPGTPEGVVALALSLMGGAGVNVAKLRKDYTQAVELLFSLPADTPINFGDYFRQCLAWAEQRFGIAYILSADIHRDEAVPHCHILILPMVDGRYMGSKLLTRPNLAELRISFARDVAAAFGLKPPPGRLHGASRTEAVLWVLDHLESTQDALLTSCLWPEVKQDIERDPARFLARLGVELAKPRKEVKLKTMAQIFTGSGKGPRVEVTGKPGMKLLVSIPIGFESGHTKATEKPRNLSCVGFGSTPRPLRAPAPPGVPALLETTRTHDCDLDPTNFDPDSGEFSQPPPAPSHQQRSSADHWVATQLSTRMKSPMGKEFAAIETENVRNKMLSFLMISENPKQREG